MSKYRTTMLKWAKKATPLEITKLEDAIEELAQEDFFGTERQFDPRGDFRDVEGYSDLDEDDPDYESEMEDSAEQSREELSTITERDLRYVIENLVNLAAIFKNEKDKESLASIHKVYNTVLEGNKDE